MKYVEAMLILLAGLCVAMASMVVAPLVILIKAGQTAYTTMRADDGYNRD